jgi:hypothetical protein
MIFLMTNDILFYKFNISFKQTAGMIRRYGKGFAKAADGNKNISEGLSSARVGEQTEMTAQSVNGWVKRFETGRINL